MLLDLGHGLFQFTVQQSRKALIAPEAPARDGAHLTRISLGAGKNQKWKVDGVDGVFFRITRFGATNSLTVRENEPDQPASKPSAVQEAPFAGAPEQLWAFTPAQDTMGGLAHPRNPQFDLPASEDARRLGVSGSD